MSELVSINGGVAESEADVLIIDFDHYREADADDIAEALIKLYDKCPPSRHRSVVASDLANLLAAAEKRAATA